MKKIILGTLALFLAVALNAQITFKPSMAQTAPDEITISFAGTIASGWHVYSPTESCKLEGGLKANKAPITKYEDMFGANVSFYEHSVTFTQKLKITGKTYKIEGYLEYGACNDQSCLPPTSVDVKYSGKGIDKPVAEDKKEDKKDEMAAEETLGTEETAAVADTVATDTVAVGIRRERRCCGTWYLLHLPARHTRWLHCPLHSLRMAYHPYDCQLLPQAQQGRQVKGCRRSNDLRREHRSDLRRSRSRCNAPFRC